MSNIWELFEVSLGWIIKPAHFTFTFLIYLGLEVFSCIVRRIHIGCYLTFQQIFSHKPTQVEHDTDFARYPRVSFNYCQFRKQCWNGNCYVNCFTAKVNKTTLFILLSVPPNWRKPPFPFSIQPILYYF